MGMRLAISYAFQRLNLAEVHPLILRQGCLSIVLQFEQHVMHRRVRFCRLLIMGTVGAHGSLLFMVSVKHEWNKKRCAPWCTTSSNPSHNLVTTERQNHARAHGHDAHVNNSRSEFSPTICLRTTSQHAVLAFLRWQN